MRQFLAVAFWVIVGCVLVFVIAPLAIVVVTSFSASMDIAFPPRGLSLAWYSRAWKHLMGHPGTTPRLGEAVMVSAMLALGTAIGAGVLGTAAACTVRHLPPRVAAPLQSAFLMPLLSPTIVTGIGLLVLFTDLGVRSPFSRLLVGHVVITVPYVILTVAASLRMRGRSLEDAALTLGATRLWAFVFITLPLLREAIFAGMAFAFLISFHHFTVTFFLYSGEWKPLPMWVFEYLGYQLDPLIAVINTSLILITVAIGLLLIRIVGLAQMGRLL